MTRLMRDGPTEAAVGALSGIALGARLPAILGDDETPFNTLGARVGLMSGVGSEGEVM
jgi:hypothetical protein